jgi:hypothetical protein
MSTMTDHTFSEPDFIFGSDLGGSDELWLKKVLVDASEINVKVKWDVDEQQAEPFHRNFTSAEFLARLRRLIKRLA